MLINLVILAVSTIYILVTDKDKDTERIFSVKSCLLYAMVIFTIISSLLYNGGTALCLFVLITALIVIKNNADRKYIILLFLSITVIEVFGIMARLLDYQSDELLVELVRDTLWVDCIFMIAYTVLLLHGELKDNALILKHGKKVGIITGYIFIGVVLAVMAGSFVSESHIKEVHLPDIQSGKEYYIQSDYNRDYYFTADNNAGRIKLEKLKYSPAQRIRFEQNKDGSWSFYAGRIARIDTKSSKVTKTARIELEDNLASTSESMKWNIYEIEGGIEFGTLDNSYYMTIRNENSLDTTDVAILDWNGNSIQKFHIVDVDTRLGFLLCFKEISAYWRLGVILYTLVVTGLLIYCNYSKVISNVKR